MSGTIAKITKPFRRFWYPVSLCFGKIASHVLTWVRDVTVDSTVSWRILGDLVNNCVKRMCVRWVAVLLSLAARGFIGSHLVDRLVRGGFEVTVLDNLSTGKLENVKHHFDDGGFRFVKGDVQDRRAVERAARRKLGLTPYSTRAGIRSGQDSEKSARDGSEAGSHDG